MSLYIAIGVLTALWTLQMALIAKKRNGVTDAIFIVTQYILVWVICAAFNQRSLIITAAVFLVFSCLAGFLSVLFNAVVSVYRALIKKSDDPDTDELFDEAGSRFVNCCMVGVVVVMFLT